MRNQGDRGNRHLDVRTIAKAGGERLVFQTKHYDELSQHGIEDAPVAEDDQVGRTSETNEPRSGRKRGSPSPSCLPTALPQMNQYLNGSMQSQIENRKSMLLHVCLAPLGRRQSKTFPEEVGQASKGREPSPLGYI